MGIGNRAAVRSTKRQTGAHYPSWGLGTRGRGVGFVLAADVSLPLMGIGNRRRYGVLALTGMSLITPHGDWEPGAEPGKARPIVSLPLMGIGNPVVADGAVALACRLITPHGDWEP